MPPRPENKAEAPRADKDLATRLCELGEECAALPDHDTRTPDKVIGYDEYGMW